MQWIHRIVLWTKKRIGFPHQFIPSWTYATYSWENVTGAEPDGKWCILIMAETFSKRFVAAKVKFLKIFQL